MKTVPRILELACESYVESNDIYQDNYKRVGNIFKVLFPEGVFIKEPMDYNRFAILMQMINKLARYSGIFHGGGHHDSLNDLIVYSAMLMELDQICQSKVTMNSVAEND